ncbi:polyketide synthase [Mycolicibacterium parafortuitum]|uniref:Polyketide synthase n=2 Tax=Mycolicibacterium parafortuitum TaxID=39692 RepID=A0A7I7U8Q8_MYCPF|nr:polyketide synthase [Mycolicibacterium parafortuitum]
MGHSLYGMPMVAPYIADEVKQRPVSTAPAALDIFDRSSAEALPDQLEKFTTVPSSELTEEIEAAASWLGVQIEEILLAAFGRMLGRTRGEGAVAVDVTGGQRWLSHPVTLLCADTATAGPTEMLQGAHAALATAPGRTGEPAEVLLNVSAGGLVDEPAGRALELRVQRLGGGLQIDWWYDAQRFDAYSVEEMAEQFPLAVVDITSDAAAPL